MIVKTDKGFVAYHDGARIAKPFKTAGEARVALDAHRDHAERKTKTKEGGPYGGKQLPGTTQGA